MFAIFSGRVERGGVGHEATGGGLWCGAGGLPTGAGDIEARRPLHVELDRARQQRANGIAQRNSPRAATAAAAAVNA